MISNAVLVLNTVGVYGLVAVIELAAGYGAGQFEQKLYGLVQETLYWNDDGCIDMKV
jgi:hypothetical protein